MRRKLLSIFFLLLLLFLTDNVNALSASEVASRGTDCPVVELADAKENGELVKVACYDSYDLAKDAMNNTNNDNLVIVEGNRIIDAKYALIDYDQTTSLKYTYVYSDRNLSSTLTYISGGSSDDAVFLELDRQTGRIKIKVSGVTGWIKLYENESTKQYILYDIVPLSWTKSPSYYNITDSEIIHVLPTNVYGTKQTNYLTIGKKPSMVSVGNYYSYDGNYFYTDLKTMINDYKNNNYNNAVNNGNPFYNYYQYVSFRTKTVYSATNINDYLNKRIASSSKLYNTGQYFIDAQNNYGVNAILMLAIGINESAFGTSPISQTKNNLFGLNAIDRDPSASANYFTSIEDCIDQFGFGWLSGKFLQPGDSRFYGSNLGNKSVGVNIKYASDPYWGEKAAQYYYDLDKTYGFQDYEYYTIAVLNNSYYNTVYAKKDPNGYNVSSSYYQYKTRGSSVAILDEVTGPSVNGNTTWYKIMGDPVLKDDLEYYSDNEYYNTVPRITYNWEKNIVYVPAAYFTKISNGGNKIENNTNNTNTDSNNQQLTSKSISSIVSEAGYHYDSGKVSSVKPGTDVQTIKTNLTNAGGTVTLLDGNNNQVDSGIIGTGYKIKILSGTEETLMVIIYGDTDGDGKISAADYVKVKNHIMGSTILGDCYMSAADANRDGSISAVDYVNIKNYIMGQANSISN